MAQKAYVPSEKDRTMVRLLCAGGILQDRIAIALGISRSTLQRHYKRDIKVGATEIDGLAVGTLVKAMRVGGKEAVMAAKWWTQARLGWSEKVTILPGDGANPTAASEAEVDAEIARLRKRPAVLRAAKSTGTMH